MRGLFCARSMRAFLRLTTRLLDYPMRKLFKLAKRWVPLLAGASTVLKNVADLIAKFSN